MLSQDKEDEARLLGAVRRPSGALEIKPGAGRTRLNRPKPGASGAFRPADRISKNARQSGPVRASQKSRTSETYLDRDHQEAEELHDFRGSNRPSKRQRQDDSGHITSPRSRQMSSLVEPSIPVTHSSRTSPVSTFSQPGARNSRQAPVVSEFRGVEATIGRNNHPYSRGRFSSVASFTDESFTLGAAAQRRSSVSAADLSERNSVLKYLKDSKSKRAPVGTIEIKDLNTVHQDEPLQHSPPSRKPQQALDPDDSPDELQGEATTHPPPKKPGFKQFLKNRLQELEHAPLSPSRKRSPSDIEPTQFIPQLTKKNKKTPRDNAEVQKSTVSLQYIRFGRISKLVEDDREISVDVYVDRLVLGANVTGNNREEVLFRHVRALIYAERSLKVRLQLRDYQHAPGSLIDMQFTTLRDRDSVRDRIVQTQDRNTKCVEKQPEWLENAFSIYNQDMRHRSNHSKPLVENQSRLQALPSPASATGKIKGKKLSSMLEGSDSESDGQLPPTDLAQEQHDMEKPEKVTDSPSKKAQTPLKSDLGVEIPVKKFFTGKDTVPQTQRETRTSTRRTRALTTNDPHANSDKSDPTLKSDTFRKNWKEPLVYPKVGKKKEEVNVEDRDRLRENQLLNDNLIAFYIRFLQDHLERTRPDVAKRVYFFNSYFFATLTNKGAREINYDAVEKWTRNVDLFSYDYIIVPINQSAHWYLAIICNLPCLAQDIIGAPEPSPSHPKEAVSSGQPAQGAKETPELPGPVAEKASLGPEEIKAIKSRKVDSKSSPSENAMHSLESLAIEDQTKAISEGELSTVLPASVDKALTSAQEQSTAKQTSKAPAKAKKKRGGIKLDPRQTAIITFDSLDAPRSPTVKLLREYICREAASKRKMKIRHPTLEIKGMRAQNIPLQPNYSDCGLYLMAYLENFVRDPDRFVARILQREMTEEDDWPPLASGLLRLRMREFLDQLYQEQSSDERDCLLADRQPISFLLGPPISDKSDAEDMPIPGRTAKPDADSGHESKAQEKLMGEHQFSQREQEDEDISSDLPVLVPMAAVSVSKPIETARSGEAVHKKHHAAPDADDILEIPDSQETAGPAPQGPHTERLHKHKLKPDQVEMSRDETDSKRLSPIKGLERAGKVPGEPSAHLQRVEVQVQPEIQVPRTPPREEKKKKKQVQHGHHTSVQID
ncbi:Ubiquitin-like-specific protease [Penicillium ucsense]|uniref:Ubiquitin-like-specific protease n=1 Tax=Penicillium ucsense TaxID=2839758 RepID=A0A8J8W3W3_9EURO|nr:Ubiquitin-like-specific protease [Penicillium ucsense]KAF7736427.1 Ubiquitin-like-specific protease [Penicillium ucsense]